MASATKYTGAGIPAAEIVFVRSLVSIFLMLSLCAQQRVKTRRDAVIVSAQALLWAQGEARDLEQPIRPGARKRRGFAATPREAPRAPPCPERGRSK
jgi:hypothetical protein